MPVVRYDYNCECSSCVDVPNSDCCGSPATLLRGITPSSSRGWNLEEERRDIHGTGGGGSGLIEMSLSSISTPPAVSPLRLLTAPMARLGSTRWRLPVDCQ